MMRLLIVDDDEQQVQRWVDSIDDFNHRNQIEIRAEYRDTLKEGFEALSSEYDGAVIDLRLSGDNDAEGNVLIKEIKNNKRFPVCVMSGYPEDLDPELKAYVERGPNLFFWVEKRDRPFQDVLQKLSTINKSGVVEIVGTNGIIETALTNIFWTHLAKTLSFWNSQEEPEDRRKQRLLRYTLSHLLSKFETTAEGDFDDCYPDEMYVIPPFRTQWQTGDIVKGKGTQDYYLILTPACDLAQDKAQRIQVVTIEGFNSGLWADTKKKLNTVKARLANLAEADEDGRQKGEAKKSVLTNNLLKLIRNSHGLQYHFLPQCQSFPGGILNFQKIVSIGIKEFTKDYEKEGTITAMFLKDVVARFSAYYGRQGQPGLESERLLTELLQ